MNEAGPIILTVEKVTLDTEALQARLAGRPREATSALRQAALGGSPAAQLVYGQILLDGRGVDRDPVAALGWFERAAHAGLPEALNMVGRCHEKGWGVSQDYPRAMPWFERASALGHIWAKVNLAQILMRLGDPNDRPRAFTLLDQAAAVGNLKAVNSLARFYEEGWVVPPDPQRAVALYRLAAERGDHWAQFNLATLLHGAGQEVDALEWLERAIARSDDGFRQRIAAVLLQQSEPALISKGLPALERCVLNGDATALVALTVVLDTGVGGPADRVRLAAICRAAATRNCPPGSRRAPALLERAVALLRRARPGRMPFNPSHPSRQDHP